jgi:hypothetical protein
MAMVMIQDPAGCLTIQTLLHDIQAIIRLIRITLQLIDEVDTMYLFS